MPSRGSGKTHSAKCLRVSAGNDCQGSNLSTFFTCFHFFNQQIQQCAWISNNLLQLWLHLFFFFFSFSIVFSLKVFILLAGSGGAETTKQMCLMLFLYVNDRRKRKRKMKALNFVPFQVYDVIMMNDGWAGWLAAQFCHYLYIYNYLWCIELVF